MNNLVNLCKAKSNRFNVTRCRDTCPTSLMFQRGVSQHRTSFIIFEYFLWINELEILEIDKKINYEYAIHIPKSIWFNGNFWNKIFHFENRRLRIRCGNKLAATFNIRQLKTVRNVYIWLSREGISCSPQMHPFLEWTYFKQIAVYPSEIRCPCGRTKSRLCKTSTASWLLAHV